MVRNDPDCRQVRIISCENAGSVFAVIAAATAQRTDCEVLVGWL